MGDPEHKTLMPLAQGAKARKGPQGETFRTEGSVWIDTHDDLEDEEMYMQYSYCSDEVMEKMYLNK